MESKPLNFRYAHPLMRINMQLIKLKSKIGGKIIEMVKIIKINAAIKGGWMKIGRGEKSVSSTKICCQNVPLLRDSSHLAVTLIHVFDNSQFQIR